VKRPCPILAALLFFLLAPFATHPLFADFVGLDQNGDLACGVPEMGFHLTAGDSGTVHTVDLFFDDLPPIISWGCVFCVEEKSLVAGESFFYAMPDSWMPIPMHDSESDPFVPVSDWIRTTYPEYKCYLVQSTDFSFSSPIRMPYALGTFSFRYAAAEDGCVGFVIDGANAGWFSTSGATGLFDGPDETCDPYHCNVMTATGSVSWGEIKSLFR